MGIKILFIYPNTYGMNMLPPAIAMFSAILKKEGHQVQIFDTTYYSLDYGIDSDGSKMERLNVVPFKMEDKGIRLNSTEDMWELGVRVLKELKDYKIKNKIPVIAGGVFSTFAPEICIKEELVDLVCVGEGENSLVDLCKKIEKNEDYSDVTNLWVKKDGKVIKKNSISKPVNINDNPIIDISLFEENRLYRPMAMSIYL